MNKFCRLNLYTVALDIFQVVTKAMQSFETPLVSFAFLDALPSSIVNGTSPSVPIAPHGHRIECFENVNEVLFLSPTNVPVSTPIVLPSATPSVVAWSPPKSLKWSSTPIIPDGNSDE